MRLLANCYFILSFCDFVVVTCNVGLSVFNLRLVSSKFWIWVWPPPVTAWNELLRLCIDLISMYALQFCWNYRWMLPKPASIAQYGHDRNKDRNVGYPKFSVRKIFREIRLSKFWDRSKKRPKCKTWIFGLDRTATLSAKYLSGHNSNPFCFAKCLNSVAHHTVGAPQNPLILWRTPL
jgi:hypothetical protein